MKSNSYQVELPLELIMLRWGDPIYQNAMNQHKPRFEFLGKEIALKPTVGFFITMNPGYSGNVFCILNHLLPARLPYPMVKCIQVVLSCRIT